MCNASSFKPERGGLSTLPPSLPNKTHRTECLKRPKDYTAGKYSEKRRNVFLAILQKAPIVTNCKVLHSRPLSSNRNFKTSTSTRTQLPTGTLAPPLSSCHCICINQENKNGNIQRELPGSKLPKLLVRFSCLSKYYL